jgi:hypothetical protein
MREVLVELGRADAKCVDEALHRERLAPIGFDDRSSGDDDLDLAGTHAPSTPALIAAFSSLNELAVWLIVERIARTRIPLKFSAWTNRVPPWGVSLRAKWYSPSNSAPGPSLPSQRSH